MDIEQVEKTIKEKDVVTAITFYFNKYTGEVKPPVESRLFEKADNFIKADAYMDIQHWSEIKRKDAMDQKAEKIRMMQNKLDANQIRIKELVITKKHQAEQIKDLKKS